MRESDVAEVDNQQETNTRQSKLANDEGIFNELFKNVNYILFYLSNVEIERAAQDSQGVCDIQDPIQIVYAEQYKEYMF